MLAGLPAASAHVEATPDKTAANSYALLTFAIPHGCNTSGTTKMTITLPAELNDAQPTVNPNWTAQKVTEQLPAPKKLANGTSITKRTSQIVYTAKAPLDPELRDTLVLSVKLPDTAGKTLYFPTLQTCEQGQTDWSQIPQEGQDRGIPQNPVTVGDCHRRPTPARTAIRPTPPASPTTGPGPRPRWRPWTTAARRPGAGAPWRPALGGLALGGAAFVRGRATNGVSAGSESSTQRG